MLTRIGIAAWVTRELVLAAGLVYATADVTGSIIGALGAVFAACISASGGVIAAWVALRNRSAISELRGMFDRRAEQRPPPGQAERRGRGRGAPPGVPPLEHND